MMAIVIIMIMILVLLLLLLLLLLLVIIMMIKQIIKSYPERTKHATSINTSLLR